MTDNIFRDLMSYLISASTALHVPTCRRRTFLSRVAYQSICNLIFHGALTPMISFSITHFDVVFVSPATRVLLFLSLRHEPPQDGKTDPAPTQQLETRDGCEGKKM